MLTLIDYPAIPRFSMENNMWKIQSDFGDQGFPIPTYVYSQTCSGATPISFQHYSGTAD